MRYESTVIDAVSDWLERSGWTVDSKVYGTRSGDDIVASKEEKEIRIEAKGESSENKRSSRYGQPIDRSQIGVHVAKAFFKAAATKQKHGCISGIALPNESTHLEMISSVKEMIFKLDLWIFWVSENLEVRIEKGNQSTDNTPGAAPSV